MSHLITGKFCRRCRPAGLPARDAGRRPSSLVKSDLPHRVNCGLRGTRQARRLCRASSRLPPAEVVTTIPIARNRCPSFGKRRLARSRWPKTGARSSKERCGTSHDWLASCMGFPVIASVAKQSICPSRGMDCFAPLAMTVERVAQPDGQITSDLQKSCQVPESKIFLFSSPQITCTSIAIPFQSEGRWPSSRRGAGCGGR